MERIVSLCKRRGFIFQAGEIYGGLNGVWDFGPLGAELKRNLKDYWWRVMVRERDDVVGLDGSILTHRAVLKGERTRGYLQRSDGGLSDVQDAPARRSGAGEKRREAMPELWREGSDGRASV